MHALRNSQLFKSRAAQLLLSALAFGVGLLPTLCPAQEIVLQIQEDRTLVMDAELSPLAQEQWEALSEGERQTLNNRRQFILEFMAQKILAHRRRVNGLFWQRLSETELVQRARESLLAINNQIIERAEFVVSCQRFGVCASGGVQFNIGIARWVVGAAVFASVDYVYDFEINQWQTQYWVDVERTRFVYSPVPTLGIMGRLFVHFDQTELETLNLPEVTYLPFAPMVLTGGQSAGGGLTIGMGLPPFLGAFASYRNAVVRRFRLGQREDCTRHLPRVSKEGDPL